jgi:hypothetical protein
MTGINTGVIFPTREKKLFNISGLRLLDLQEELKKN